MDLGRARQREKEGKIPTKLEVEKMGAVRSVMGDVVPCIAMVSVEACTIFLTILASTAMARGMSPFVFVVYTNALASIILLPYSFMNNREKTEQPLFTSHLLLRVFFLGLIGVAIAQNLAFLGLYYSSPIVACGMANVLPAFSFILAALLRTTKIDWKSPGSLARILGTLISVFGAISITFYKGPPIKQYSFALSSLRHAPLLLAFTSRHENWVLGCLLFAAGSLALSVWNMIQVETIKKHPQVMQILSLYSLIGTILAAALSVIIERDSRAWKLELNLEFLVIVLTAIFQSLIRSNIQLWCIRKKGPHFVAAFKPVGIPVASTCGCILFADTFHYGSMLSAIICGLGYYAVIWGQMRDEEPPKESAGSGSSYSKLPDEKVPLLEEDSEV